MSGNNRIVSGKLSQSKTKGKAFLKEYHAAYEPEKFAKEDGDEDDK